MRLRLLEALWRSCKTMHAHIAPPMSDSCAHAAMHAGNLLRGGDKRGYNSLAKMYTIEHARAVA